MPKTPLSVIIPTRNEERNIRDAVESVVEWADEVWVLDSYSEDRTIEIAEQAGAQIARRKFDNFAAQKNWALDNLPLHNEWVFLLDADERITHGLSEDIREIVAAGNSCDGYYVARKNHFMGQWIRHAGMFPDWQLRLFKRQLGRYENRLVHEHVVLNGRAGYLKHPLEHNDFKGLQRWFDRHNVYTSMEAIEIFRLTRVPDAQRLRARWSARGPERTRRVKEFAYRYLPCRAPLVFLWMYLLRAGFLDGRAGFRYCLLKAFVDYQTSLKVVERESAMRLPRARELTIPRQLASRE
jgi:glycosyltransferase involved in cell wall biosynthesis